MTFVPGFLRSGVLQNQIPWIFLPRESSQFCKDGSKCSSDHKDLECARLLEQKSDWIQNEFVHDGSVKHPWTYYNPTSNLPTSPLLFPGGQTGGQHAQDQNASGGEGRVDDIDSTSTVLGERRVRGGQQHFSYKANSRPISSHILSGDFFFTFSPPFFLSALHSLFHFYSVKAKKRRRKKNKVDKGCPPSCHQREEGVQIALQKTGLRAEISHNAADKKVGHITFGRHVMGMQTAAGGIVERTGMGREDAAEAATLEDEVKVGEGGRMRREKP